MKMLPMQAVRAKSNLCNLLLPNTISLLRLRFPAKQAAEKGIQSCKKCQGTTIVVP
jgi:hypothetical protein